MLLLLLPLSSALIEDKLVGTLFVEDLTGNPLGGNFNMSYIISNSSSCSPILFSQNDSVTVPSDGVLNITLLNTNLTYNEQYYFCLYRDGVYKLTYNFVYVPYAYRAKYINWSGIENPPTNLSQFINDIPSGSTNLTDYYTKNQTYNKTEVYNKSEIDANNASWISTQNQTYEDYVKNNVSNNSNLLQGLTPQQVAALYNETDSIFTSANSSLARTGNCPSGQVVQNTTIGGVQCVAITTTESDPVFVAENSTIVRAGTASVLCSAGQSPINMTFVQNSSGAFITWGCVAVSGGSSFNQNLNTTNSPTFVNITSTGFFLGDGSKLTGITGGNSSWNQSLADTIYLKLNQSTAQTLTGSPIFGDRAANQLAYFDASKKLSGSNNWVINPSTFTLTQSTSGGTSTTGVSSFTTNDAGYGGNFIAYTFKNDYSWTPGNAGYSQDVVNFIGNINTNNQINGMIGARSSLTYAGTGVRTLGYGFVSNMNFGGSDTIENIYHFYAATKQGSEAVTDAFGLYIESQKGTNVANGWGVYQAGANDNNYFAGQINFDNNVVSSDGMYNWNKGTSTLKIGGTNSVGDVSNCAGTSAAGGETIGEGNWIIDVYGENNGVFSTNLCHTETYVNAGEGLTIYASDLYGVSNYKLIMISDPVDSSKNGMAMDGIDIGTTGIPIVIGSLTWDSDVSVKSTDSVKIAPNYVETNDVFVRNNLYLSYRGSDDYITHASTDGISDDVAYASMKMSATDFIDRTSVNIDENILETFKLGNEIIDIL